MSKQYLIRLISSDEHAMARNDLIKRIKMTGTDRYNDARLQQFNDFYAKHNVDFFAEQTDEEHLESTLKKMAMDFPKKSSEDRHYAVHPDVAIIYDENKCRMLKNVYAEHENSDCYQFIGNPLDALVEVRGIE